MNTYSELIEPGAPLRLSLGGRVLLVQRSASGPVLDIKFKQGGGSQSVERVGSGFKASPVGGFDGIEISASAVGVVDFIITDGEVQIPTDATKIGNDDGEAIPIRTPAGAPLEVLFGGTVAPVVGTISNTDEQAIPVAQKVGASFNVKTYLAVVVTDFNPVAINAAGVTLLAVDTARRGLRVKNVGANPVAIGGAAVTFANAAVLVQPGETWNENEAPGAEWHAICGATLASTLNIQTIS